MEDCRPRVVVGRFLPHKTIQSPWTCYRESFLSSKLGPVRAIAASIDGDVHAHFVGVEALEDPEYRRYLVYLDEVMSRDASITYLYTITRDSSTMKLRYALDAEIVRADTLWIETDYFALRLFWRDGHPRFHLRRGSARLSMVTGIQEAAVAPGRLRAAVGATAYHGIILVALLGLSVVYFLVSDAVFRQRELYGEDAMGKRPMPKDWLPLAPRGKVSEAVPTGEAFRSEWIDFERGIRVGNLEPHERITRILKHYLEERYATGFVTDRWGRGVHWQWICWLPRANREAKPISHQVNFGCAKLFISIDRSQRIFQCGLQVERGYVKESPGSLGAVLAADWDWHRLLKGCGTSTPFDSEIRRLVKREGFTARVDSEGGSFDLTAKTCVSARQIRDAAKRCRPDRWAGFQLFYPMPQSEVRASSGYELVRAVCGVFDEVREAMNTCMQVPLTPVKPVPDLGHKAAEAFETAKGSAP